MLTQEETLKLRLLISGDRPAGDGLEKHFLRIISGSAQPCSTKEQQWFEYWQQKILVDSSPKTSAPEPATKAHTAELNDKINLNNDISKLENDLRLARQALKDKDKTIAALDQKVTLLGDWLSKTHETLKKYEPVKPPEPTLKLDDGTDWSICHACGRSIDFCRCSG